VTIRSLIFTARRWGFSAKRRASQSRALLASLGIAVGVMALIVVMGVMGGLQNSYINSILEVSSFHVRVELPRTDTAEAESGELLARLRSTPGIASAVIFKECQAIAVGPSAKPVALTLRAMPAGSQKADQALVRALGLRPEAEFPVSGSLVLGKEAAAQLGIFAQGIDEGAQTSLAPTSSGQGSSPQPSSARVELMGVSQTEDEGVTSFSGSIPAGSTFTSGYYDFDAGMGFLSMPAPPELEKAFAANPAVIGIKLTNRFDDYAMGEQIKKMMPGSDYAVTTWRDYNRGFFGALRTEKTIMLLLVSLIFLVVAINVYHSLRRTIAMKHTDIAALKAIGASNSDIRGIFAQEGFSIGFVGALAGTAAGLLVASNLNAILDGIAAFLRAAGQFFALLGLRNGGGDYRLFSPAYFYIDKIPVDISSGEIVFIACLAVASTGISAILASRRVSEAIPFEVLRNE